ncbi:P-loop containing nucleoside triphosphate hydrolase protein [Amanita rubescens]|nr:P-loop containing nucleoside triphosphate hydrolase protein [Amanita rubescens]
MYFDLPRICVIGGQSAGKSSLVEAVSGINVPRDSGTCTRCPMECTMTQDEQWSCTISLRLEFDANGDPYPIQETVPFGPTLTNKDEVEIWLRRAQAAILSPHIQSSDFHGKSRDDIGQLQKTDRHMKGFSKNTIHVDVKDPDITGLSFVDLPGLIQNSQTPELIDLVKDLVISNIAYKNTLILIAIPMSDDIENQQAVRLAKEADPAGERTIGVLTKPDTVLSTSMGQLKKWREVLEGKTNILQHGYYCVRLPDEAERLKKLSRAETEGLAERFFKERFPWNKMKDRGRLGVPNLVRDVSALLVQWIEKNLPFLRKQLESLLKHCYAELNGLPPRLTNEPSSELLLRISKFSGAFHNVVNATDEKTMVRKARERYEQYKLEILETGPDFRPFVSHEGYCKPGPPKIEEEPVDSLGGPMDLMYVQQVIKNSIGWELPGHVPFDATKKLVLDITCQWREPSLSCFDDIHTLTLRKLDALVHEHFCQFPNAESYIRSLVHAELDRCKGSAQQAVESLLELESVPLFTQNTHYLQNEETKWLEHFKFIHFRAPAHRDELVVMAHVQAYFRVAYKRIIDYMPLTIEHSLNRTLDLALQNKLLNELTREANFAERAGKLLTESADIAEKRRALSEQKNRLLQIRELLLDVSVEDDEEELNNGTLSIPEQSSVSCRASIFSLASA